MRSFLVYATSEFNFPKARKRNAHGDVDLLAHLAFLVAVKHYAVNGEPLSRDACFRIAWNYIVDELWPLTSVAPDNLRRRTVFLGKGRFARGSWRRWVGDLQGVAGAERFSDAANLRLGKARDKTAKAVHSKADVHLENIIGIVATRVPRPENTTLLDALRQLHKELF